MTYPNSNVIEQKQQNLQSFVFVSDHPSDWKKVFKFSVKFSIIENHITGSVSLQSWRIESIRELGSKIFFYELTLYWRNINLITEMEKGMNMWTMII